MNSGQMQPHARLSERRPQKRGGLFTRQPSITRFGPIRHMDRDNARQSPALVPVMNGRAQNSQFTPDRPSRSSTGSLISAAGLAAHLSDCLPFPEWRQRLDSSSDAPGSSSLFAMLKSVISKHVRYEHLRGITGASVAVADVDELGERDLSLSAICSARAALPAATAFSPDDVVTAPLFEEAEPGAGVSTRHGCTVLSEMNCSIDSRGTITRLPTTTWPMRPTRTSPRT
jgi:hypothetical protein